MSIDTSVVVGLREPFGGQFGVPRLGAAFDQIVNAAGPYSDLARRGVLYHAQTAVAGVAPGTSIGTTAAFALYNPAAIDVYVLWAGLSYVSGTLGIGVIDWISHAPGTVTTGTAIPAQNGLAGGATGLAKPFTTATVVTGGVPMRGFANLPPMLATSVLTPWLAKDDVGGAIVIPSGCTVSLQGTAGAGTSPLVRFSILYAELPAARQ